MLVYWLDRRYIVNGKRYTHTFATFKRVEDIKKEWKHSNPTKAWIREDMKFHALKHNPLQELKLDKLPHPDKYASLVNPQGPRISKRKTLLR
ncbi:MULTISPECIES: hypothetical protein [Bacillus]|uniref:Uncharacterized protein n=2 Tax=Bacillus TaxID=1386 RepID=A0A0M4GAF1_9BACI|nr:MULTISPECIES: hypothetical protein [Bacillus]ALC82490.1 hypothetical protein AM592_13520 [Bacillus gobiensis]MBP1081381.1 hypothetical protein [Bacillus capparidis]MED1096054.1 hypothetical protein [Bacillus capparidis]